MSTLPATVLGQETQRAESEFSRRVLNGQAAGNQAVKNNIG
jgi:hypothetical protein